MHDVTCFECIRGYVLRVHFDDDTEQEIDFEPILFGPLFAPLRDLRLFGQVHLDHDLGTLVWPTGADIDPTVLHDWPDHVDAIVRRRMKRFMPEGLVPA